MRLSSPSAVTEHSSQVSSVCSWHVALAEEDAALGVEPRGEQDRRRVEHALAQLRGVVGDGDRVQVDDAVDRLAAVLPLDVLADRADVVAEVLAPRSAGCPLKIRMRQRRSIRSRRADEVRPQQWPPSPSSRHSSAAARAPGTSRPTATAPSRSRSSTAAGATAAGLHPSAQRPSASVVKAMLLGRVPARAHATSACRSAPAALLAPMIRVSDNEAASAINAVRRRRRAAGASAARRTCAISRPATASSTPPSRPPTRRASSGASTGCCPRWHRAYAPTTLLATRRAGEQRWGVPRAARAAASASSSRAAGAPALARTRARRVEWRAPATWRSRSLTVGGPEHGLRRAARIQGIARAAYLSPIYRAIRMGFGDARRRRVAPAG